METMEGYEETTPFIFRSPFLRPEQRDEATRQNLVNVEEDLRFIEEHGYDRFAERCDRRDGSSAGNVAEGGEEEDDAPSEGDLGSAFDGSLRDYQIYMLERAKRSNVVVHLGTGMGKTLIAIFLIKEYL